MVALAVDTIPQLTLGTSDVLVQLPVPFGKNYRVTLNVRVYHPAGGALVYLRHPDACSALPSWNASPLGMGTGANNQSLVSSCTVVTDKLGRIAASSVYAGTICNIGVVGWEQVDPKPVLDISLQHVAPGGRIDAIADFGGGIFAATRAGTSTSAQGKVYERKPSGWSLHASLTSSQGITCLFPGLTGDQGFALGHTSDLWEKPDGTDAWAFIGKVSTRAALPNLGLSYSGCVLPSGTILIATSAGYVYRKSITDTSFTEIFVDAGGVYRMMKVADGVICNTWSGKVYKNTDDGWTWNHAATLSSGPLYAIEYCGSGRVLIGSVSGKIYESTCNGDVGSFYQIQALDGEADDFCAFGDCVVYSAYTSQKNVYLRTAEGGFRCMGNLPNGDWMDHVIATTINGEPAAIGGTSQGYVAEMKLKSLS